MAICNLPVKCISVDLCENCAYIELDINRIQLWGDDGNCQNINEIYCTKFKQCTAMMNHLNAANKTEEISDE
jgi:hypothetical protein